ncbi:SPOR domain-containing protein [Yoonia sp.]|uniref:SPOR domain-containing protein n=1 Tax=Yoonia sp. TaxID=2212373 RepID=UPI0025E87BE7|nr:SPOR domain-containing protein [Yoonia sp.]
MAVYDQGFAPSAGAPRVTNLVNYAGAALSLALILGVSFWGYKLIMRDVSGIPVVRAMEGDMRVLPENPGGAVAMHTGLAVNEVAAMGEAGGLEDRLVLAPRTSGLAQEDIEAQPTSDVSAGLGAVALTAVIAPVAPAAEFDEIAALTEQLAAGITPIAPSVDLIAASVPGLATSVRPMNRPAALRVVAVAPMVAATAGATEVAVNTEVFPAGTNLVQLGAFPNPTLAGQEWDRLQARFGQLMSDRGRVIQVSNQSSGTWYRLRASGFNDRAEARRLCAALQAEGTECIPVVVN